VGVIILYKFARYVAAMAVKDKETVISSCSLACFAVEYILKLGQSDLIAALA